MFPVYILDGKTQLPQKGTFYIVAKDGIFLSKDTGLIRAIVKVSGISFLQQMEVKAELRLPQVPSVVLAEALLFFRRVYEKHESEAIVLLYYSAQENQYLIDAPKQQVDGASVHYEPLGKFTVGGYQLIGTIHSHPSFQAFHSGTDVDDEKYFDGIHITIGRVDTPYFTISCTVAVNNNRFVLDPEKLIIGLSKVDYQPPRVFYSYKRPLGVPRKKAKEFSFGEKTFDWLSDLALGVSYYQPAAQFFDLVLPDGLDYRNCQFPHKWLDRVYKKKAYTAAFSLDNLFIDIQKDDTGGKP